MGRSIEAIVIGGSAGSFDVLFQVLGELPADFPAPIAIVVHLLPTAPSLVWRVLGAHCRLPVREAEDKEPFRPGTIYVAPPNYHLLIERHRELALSVDAPVYYSRPSIDVLFASAAEAYGAALAGVVLSGASADGADGLRRIHEAGGLAVVQDPDTASARTMPEAAVAGLRGAAQVLPVAQIAPLLADVTENPRDQEIDHDR